MQTLNILGPVPNLDCFKIATIELRQNAYLVLLFVNLAFMSGIAILKIHNYIPDSKYLTCRMVGTLGCKVIANSML